MFDMRSLSGYHTIFNALMKGENCVKPSPEHYQRSVKSTNFIAILLHFHPATSHAETVLFVLTIQKRLSFSAVTSLVLSAPRNFQDVIHAVP